MKEGVYGVVGAYLQPAENKVGFPEGFSGYFELAGEKIKGELNDRYGRSVMEGEMYDHYLNFDKKYVDFHSDRILNVLNSGSVLGNGIIVYWQGNYQIIGPIGQRSTGGIWLQTTFLESPFESPIHFEKANPGERIVAHPGIYGSWIEK